MDALSQPRLEALVERTAAGDSAAFRALYEASSAKLYGIALRICRDRGLAQDVLQDAFVKVWTRASSYRPEHGRAMTWLASVTRNSAIDAMRKRKDVVLGTDDEGRQLIESLEMPAEGMDPVESGALRTCLEGIEEEHRTCIVLAYCAGYSREELASRFDRPTGTIKTWLHRGLAALRDCLGAP